MTKEEIKKLAEWAGFDWKVCSGDYPWDPFNHWADPKGNKVDRIPNFPESLDACFKWLVPSLFEKGLFLSLITDKRFNRATILSGLLDRNDKVVAIGEGKTPAEALCKAILKLVEASPTRREGG